MTYYRTELMDKILTSKEALKIVGQVSAIYGESYVGLWLFQALGMELDEVIAWGTEYNKQVVPQTATWSLQYYEQMYNIAGDSHLTDEQRRSQILSTILTRAPMNPSKVKKILVEIVNDQTASVEIKENTGKNTFSILITLGVQSVNFRRIIEKLNDLKPAHIIYSLDAAQHSFVSLEISTESMLRISCEVRIRSNAEDLFLDGTWFLDGTYPLAGFKIYNIEGLTEYYPAAFKVLSEYREEINVDSAFTNYYFAEMEPLGVKADSPSFGLMSDYEVSQFIECFKVKMSVSVVADKVENDSVVMYQSPIVVPAINVKSPRVEISTGIDARPEMYSAVATKAEITVDPPSYLGKIIVDNEWMLDGEYFLDGVKFLDSDIYEIIL